MQSGTIVNLHIARVKGTPSDPVQSARAVSAEGLDGDRSRNPRNLRQVLVMDQETLDHFGLQPGQVKENITVTGLDLSQARQGNVFFIGNEDNHVTLEVTGDCEPCQKMDALIPGLRQEIFGKRGILTVVLQGGEINVGDSIRLEP
ncbi:MAG: MOSC domain-containing protein [Chloroflexi bacterium]|nr:MOSC domain-containing protein [Chloroflexota bacterium]MYD49555.1 MOSC domain-containing protein [Chloroflexota bacterium]